MENFNFTSIVNTEVQRLADEFKKSFLDCEDVKSITGLGRDNVRNLMRSKEFPTTKVGKRQVVSIVNFVI